LVEERLAACAQVIGPVASVYWWEGRVQQSTEWYCHLKTTLVRLPELQQRILQLHPYELPELIALPVIDGDHRYLKWIADAVGREAKSDREPSDSEPAAREPSL
jgi:periplasmic divalent cation tolerance protein